MPSSPLIRLLTAFLGRSRRLLALLVVFQALQTFATLFLPTLNADIIDRGVIPGDHGYIWRMGAVMIVITLAQVVAAGAAIYLGAKIAMAFGRDVRAATFHQVTGFSAHEVAHFGAPSLITRITNDVTQVQTFVLMVCTMLVAAPIAFVGAVALALHQDATLSWLLTVSIPLLVVIVLLVVRRMVPQFRVMQDWIDRLNQVLREQITGMRVVRAFVRESAESARFRGVNDRVAATALTAGRLQALMFPMVMMVLHGSSVAVVWFGAGRVERGAMGIGALVAFLTYLIQILMSVMMTTFIAVLAPRASVCAERINEVLDTETSIVPPAHGRTGRDEATIEFDDVSFNYPGAEVPVLADVDLRTGPGQVTAVIGSTGSGKSTLLNLVPRLFDVTAGAVRVGGVDVRELDANALWARIGLVPQRPYLFSGTVRSNLLFARPDATDDELWEALDVAQARDFVAAMPGGLDARIAQGGTNVSGGQRQRLAIARALVRQPDIYLFDDSFSALDLATDARLRAALAPRIADAAVIVVAQRVATIRDADQIVVLEDGRIVGLGRHDDLLATCPTYREIVDSQLSAEERAA